MSGTAEGEGLVGPRPHHFFAPRPHFWKIKYYDFIPFFDFQYEKIISIVSPPTFHLVPRSLNVVDRVTVTSKGKRQIQVKNFYKNRQRAVENSPRHF